MEVKLEEKLKQPLISNKKIMTYLEVKVIMMMKFKSRRMAEMKEIWSKMKIWILTWKKWMDKSIKTKKNYKRMQNKISLSEKMDKKSQGPISMKIKNL